MKFTPGLVMLVLVALLGNLVLKKEERKKFVALLSVAPGNRSERSEALQKV